MSPFRRNMLDKARAILRDEIIGNRAAAAIALNCSEHADNLELFCDIATSDEELNAMITREVKAELGV